MNTINQMFPNLGGTHRRSVSAPSTFKVPYGQTDNLRNTHQCDAYVRAYGTQSIQSDVTFSVDSLETDLFSFMDELNERGMMFDTYVMLDVPHTVFTFMCADERQLASQLVHKFKLNDENNACI